MQARRGIRGHAAAIDEFGDPPVAPHAGFHLGTERGQEVAANYRTVRVLRADRLVVIAANRVVAAGKEALRRRQLAEVLDPVGAVFIAQQHAGATTDRIRELSGRMRLRSEEHPSELQSLMRISY